MYKLKKDSLDENVPNKDMIISALHIVKHKGRYYLPIDSNKFKPIPKQLIEYYHIETADYCHDWFTANNCLVETYSDGCKRTDLIERYHRIKEIRKGIIIDANNIEKIN